jgi:hypothetical protein
MARPGVPIALSARDLAALLRAAAGAPVAMLVDAARDPKILPLLAALEPEVEIACLWQGEAATNLADVAPYLLALAENEAAAGFAARGWGRAWGIFVATPLPLAQLRRGLRRFTLARRGDEVMQLRLQDPRVLRAVLPSLSAAQLAGLFDGLDALLVEASGGDALLRYRLDRGALATDRLPLPPARGRR